jgi:hypothetical protein
LVEESGLPPVQLYDLRHGAATLMLLAGDELKAIADQLGHSSVVLTVDTYLSAAVELGLKSAAKAARLVLNAGKRPPGGGDVRKTRCPRTHRNHRLTRQAPRNALTTARGPTLPKTTKDPDNANPARQPGLRHALKADTKPKRPNPGPMMDPPGYKK